MYKDKGWDSLSFVLGNGFRDSETLQSLTHHHDPTGNLN